MCLQAGTAISEGASPSRGRRAHAHPVLILRWHAQISQLLHSGQVVTGQLQHLQAKDMCDLHEIEGWVASRLLQRLALDMVV